MKKFISAILVLRIITALTGCALSNDKEVNLDNLDYENATVIENTPNTGKWRKMSFEFQHLSKESPDKMVRFATSYGVNIKKDDIMLMLFNSAVSEMEFVPLSKYDDYVKNVTKYEDYPFVSANYSSDDFYIEVQAPTGGMVELENRKNVNSILELGIDWKTGPWRPYFYKISDPLIDIDDESATCVLDGKTVKIADAIKNAEKYVLENDVLFPKSFGARVKEGTLISYENTDNQSLFLVFEYTIDGVVLEGSSSTSIYDENGKSYKTFSAEVQCGMLTENTIDWIWFPAIDGGTEFTSEDCEIAISREEACEIVSRKLSQEYTFNVEEIQLMYVAERAGSGELYSDPSYARIEPMWRFYITDIKAQEYSRLYVYVSAIDGEVQISQVMN